MIIDWSYAGGISTVKTGYKIGACSLEPQEQNSAVYPKILLLNPNDEVISVAYNSGKITVARDLSSEEMEAIAGFKEFISNPAAIFSPTDGFGFDI